MPDMGQPWTCRTLDRTIADSGGRFGRTLTAAVAYTEVHGIDSHRGVQHYLDQPAGPMRSCGRWIVQWLPLTAWTDSDRSQCGMYQHGDQRNGVCLVGVPVAN